MRSRKIVGKVESKIPNREMYSHFLLNNRTRGLSEATQKSYISIVKPFIDWVGNKPIKPITFNLYIDKKMQEGLKMVSIASLMKHIRAFINFCISNDYLPPMTVPIPKFEIEAKTPYSEEELRRLLKRPKSNAFNDWRNWAMVNFFIGTGMRLSTVLHIKVRHLNLGERTVFLDWNKDKIKKTMPLSKKLVDVIKEWLQLSGLDYDDYLFPEEGGKLFSTRGAEDAIAEYNESRKVKKHSIHLFRHTYATEYIKAGGSVEKLQKLLNHKSIETTMGYVKLLTGDLAKNYEQFNPLDRLIG